MLKDPQIKKTLPAVENLMSRLLSDEKCSYCEQKTKGARFIPSGLRKSTPAVAGKFG